MRLLSLRLINFRQYDDARIEFRPGITAVVGANGSGKTTLLEAIAWALYGSPAVRGSLETLKRATAPARSPVEVALEFALDGHRYRLSRRPDRAALYLDDAAAPIHGGVAPVNAAVRRLLGMDYRAFFTSYFTGQKELAFLSGMGKAERAASVGRMLGYERLSRAREWSNQDRLALDREIEGLQRGMGDPVEIAAARAAADAAMKAAVAEADSAVRRLKQARKALEALRPRFELSVEREKRYGALARRKEQLELERGLVDQSIQSHRSEIARLDALTNEWAEIQPRWEEYQAAERDYEALGRLLPAERERRRIGGQIEGSRGRLAELRGRSEGIEPARESLNGARSRVADAETARRAADAELARVRAEWTERVRCLKTEREALEKRRKQLVDRRDRIEALGPEGVCPTCSRPLGDDHRVVADHFRQEIGEIDRDVDRIRTEAAALGTAPAEESRLKDVLRRTERDLEAGKQHESDFARKVQAIEIARRDLTAEIDAVARLEDELKALPAGFDADRFDQLREIGTRLKPVARRAAEIGAELKRRPDWYSRLQEAEDRWVRICEQVDEVDKEVKSIKFDPAAHAALSGEFAASEVEERAAERAASQSDAERARAEGAVSAARQREEEYARKAELLKESRSRRLHLRTVTDALEGLRVDLNAQARPELEEIAGRFMEQLTDGRYRSVQLTENYEPFILEDDERKPVISGGEEDVTHLCLRLAISQMIAERSGRPLTLMILDEIFGSLDSYRRDNVVALLQNLKALFEQIVLITHIESVHDGVDQCLWVRYDPNTRTSRIEETREAPADWEDGVIEEPEAA